MGYHAPLLEMTYVAYSYGKCGIGEVPRPLTEVDFHKCAMSCEVGVADQSVDRHTSLPKSI